MTLFSRFRHRKTPGHRRILFLCLIVIERPLVRRCWRHMYVTLKYESHPGDSSPYTERPLLQSCTEQMCNLEESTDACWCTLPPGSKDPRTLTLIYFFTSEFNILQVEQMLLLLLTYWLDPFRVFWPS